MVLRPLRIAAFAVCLSALFLAAAWYEFDRPLAVPAASVAVRVPAGATARSVARELQAAGVGVDQTLFVAAARLWDVTRHLRAGRYRIVQGASLRSILAQLRRGDVEPERVVVVEGITFDQLRAQLAACEDLRHDTAGWPEEKILAAIGAQEPRAEGLFAPNTYSYVPGASDLDVLRQAYAEQKERLARAWASRAEGLPYGSPYEALVMASLVEKETGRPNERPLVAAVFVNRERRSMPLQTDPSVIYGLGAQYEGRLHKRDLRADTPYNTYTRPGLPPTPIALPGLAAIRAALNPAASNALYFVARGDGSSEFSATLADQNRAVNRYVRRHRGPSEGE